MNTIKPMSISRRCAGSGNRAEDRVATPRPPGGQPDDENRARRAEAEDDAADPERDQPEQHAGADPAGEDRQVGFRKVALDESDVRAGALDVVGRADEAHDVAALGAGPGSRGRRTVPR